MKARVLPTPNAMELADSFIEAAEPLEASGVNPRKKTKHSSAVTEPEAPLRIIWSNVILFIYLHCAALYGLYLAVTVATWKTILWAVLLYVFSGLGITAGAHRYWAHRTYKAKLPLQVFLAAAQTLAFQNDIYVWCRDHRVHHKFSETNADPHNARRGFFFAHMGWLLVRKHPDVLKKGSTVDCSDLLRDPIVAFQHKYYVPLGLVLNFAVPTFVPWYFWSESLRVSFFVASMLRYVFTLNVTWLVNSAAHIWGNHPYDRNINPTENSLVSLLAGGEGWHNYHHTFPWDYKTAELGNYRLNLTTGFIDLWAKLGLAYDLKTAPKEMVYRRVRRTGDGTHPLSEELLKCDTNFDDACEEYLPNLDY